MKKQRFSTEQIVSVLKQVELGMLMTDLIRCVGITEQALTFGSPRSLLIVCSCCERLLNNSCKYFLRPGDSGNAGRAFETSVPHSRVPSLPSPNVLHIPGSIRNAGKASLDALPPAWATFKRVLTGILKIFRSIFCEHGDQKLRLHKILS